MNVFFDFNFANCSMYCMLWLFMHILFCTSFYSTHVSKDISFMHCNQSISFYKYHFIHPCISIELFKFSFNSFHSLYLILYISLYESYSIHQIINFNSMHVILCFFFYASLSIYSFLRYLYSFCASVYMNFIIKDVDHMLWFIIGW